MFPWKKNKEDAPVITPEERKIRRRKEVLSTVYLVLGILVFRSVFYEPFKIPSGSMIPTLLIGDFILVNKFAYGFKVPFSDFFSDPIYITGPSQPKHGDVIVFINEKDDEKNYIKRVVGLPGDTIQVIDKVVYVNDKPTEAIEMDGTKIMEDMDDKYKFHNFKFFKTKTGEHTHVAQIHEDNAFTANYPRIKVPENSYFCMGDNRDFSYDSRSWGFVPFNKIKGRAFFIWFSFSMKMPWSEAEETWKFRPWRIGTVIDDAPGLN